MVRLNNVRAKSEEGTGKQEEWNKVKGGRSKRVESLKGIGVKNRFSIWTGCLRKVIQRGIEKMEQMIY